MWGAEAAPPLMHAPGGALTRASGARALATDAAGAALWKWRVRAQRVKVHDQHLKPLGIIRWRGQGAGALDTLQIQAFDPASAPIALTRAPAGEEVAITPSGYTFRVKAARWTLSAPAGQIWGEAERDARGEVVWRDGDGKLIARASREGDVVVVKRGDTIVARARHVEPLALLVATSLPDELDALTRATIAIAARLALTP